MIDDAVKCPGKVSVGLICLDSTFPKPVGHIRNPVTFNFPVIPKVLKGMSVKQIVADEKAVYADIFIDAAKALENEGVSAITGSCGFMSLYQNHISNSVNTPVFMSSLIQIPMVSKMLRKDQIVGILTANRNSLSIDHLKAVGADQIPIIIAGMECEKEFREVILEGKRDNLDFKKFEKELLGVAENLISKNCEIGALVLECTDMTCFSTSLRKRFGLPIFDLITLTEMIYNTIAL